MIVDQTGHRLKIPGWMTNPEAALLCLSKDATLSPRALFLLMKLIKSTITSSESDDTVIHGTLCKKESH